MALTDVQKTKINDLMQDPSLTEFISVHELSHMTSKIFESPTEETLHEVQDYLAQFPYQRLGQPTMLNTIQTKSLRENAVKLILSEVRKIIEE